MKLYLWMLCFTLFLEIFSTSLYVFDVNQKMLHLHERVMWLEQRAGVDKRDIASLEVRMDLLGTAVGQAGVHIHH